MHMAFYGMMKHSGFSCGWTNKHINFCLEPLIKDQHSQLSSFILFYFAYPASSNVKFLFSVWQKGYQLTGWFFYIHRWNRIIKYITLCSEHCFSPYVSVLVISFKFKKNHSYITGNWNPLHRFHRFWGDYLSY